MTSDSMDFVPVLLAAARQSRVGMVVTTRRG
jgi:hypothetical protein